MSLASNGSCESVKVSFVSKSDSIENQFEARNVYLIHDVAVMNAIDDSGNGNEIWERKCFGVFQFVKVEEGF